MYSNTLFQRSLVSPLVQEIPLLLDSLTIKVIGHTANILDVSIEQTFGHGDGL